MTVQWGVESQGFVRPSVAEITADLNTRFQLVFGQSVQTDPRSVFGQTIGILAGALDDIWQLAQSVYAAFDPRQSTGDQLTALGQVTGTYRKAPTPSQATLILTGNALTTIPLGSLVQDGVGVQFATAIAAILNSAPLWQIGHAYNVGDVITNSSKTYYCLVAGVSGLLGPGASTPFPATIQDGSVTWVFVGLGTAIALGITANAVIAGPQLEAAWGLSNIATPVVGWQGVGNPLAALTGTAIESDSALRVRRYSELHGLSKAALDAVYAAVSALTLVQEAIVIENVESTTSVDGLPPHSVEAVALGAYTPLQIGQALLSTVAAGIKTNGLNTVSVADTQGGVHSIEYTSPVAVPIYIGATLYVNETQFPDGGALIAAAAILAFGQTLRIDYDVEPTAISAAIFEAGLPGLLATVIALDTVPITPFSPGITVPINLRQIASFSSSNISVTVVYKQP